MSLLPIVFDDDFDLDVWPWPSRRRRRQRRSRDPLDDFALGIHPQDLSELLSWPSEARQLHQRTRDWQQRREGLNELVPTVGKDGFQVSMDIQQFNPNEITVKTVDDQIIVEGKHEERPDEHGYISRQFTRRYTLPKGYDPNSVCSTLSSDGVLTIKAPPPQQLESNERVVSIQQTGPARLSVKENQPVENAK